MRRLCTVLSVCVTVAAAFAHPSVGDSSNADDFSLTTSTPVPTPTSSEDTCEDEKLEDQYHADDRQPADDHQNDAQQPSREALARATTLSRPRGGVWDYLSRESDRIRGHRRWGNALDAGTGGDSLQWIRAQVRGGTAATWAAI